MSSDSGTGLNSMTDVRKVLTGMAFGESPRWHDGHLVVSDWGAGEVLRLEDDGSASIIARADSFPMCVDFLPDGRLLVVAGDTLLRQEPDGSLVAHADLTAIGPSANDIVVDPRGNAYVNGIGFRFGQEEPRPGSIALVTLGGAGTTVQVVGTDLQFPNGMAILPDGRTLVVGESYGSCLTAYDIETDGTLSGRRVWAATGDDHPDGICADAEGAVWYADVAGHHCVRVAEGGRVLQTVDVDRGAFACVLGGPDRRTLYIVTNLWGPNGPQEGRNSEVVAVKVDVPGAGHP